MLSERENYLRVARFQGGEYIPVSVAISDATMSRHGPELERIAARYPSLFPSFAPGQRDYQRYPFPAETTAGELIDPWGCKWRCEINGMVGTVVEHPLAEWSALEGYRPPTATPQRAQRFTGDWAGEHERVRRARREGRLAAGGLYHGFFFMRLTYLRGFENLMCDLIEQPPELARLIEMVKGHCAEMLARWLEMDLDVIGFGEDLGTQSAAIVSPAMFARYVTPVYRELMQPARAAGMLVHLHSDGAVLELLDEFAKAGVDIINPQDLVNGIDNLARQAKGRFCIDLDVDRQRIVPFGSRRDIHDLIEEEVRKLGDPAGGLMLKIGIYPPTPPENVDAVCEAFEKFRTWFRD